MPVKAKAMPCHARQGQCHAMPGNASTVTGNASTVTGKASTTPSTGTPPYPGTHYPVHHHTQVPLPGTHHLHHRHCPPVTSLRRQLTALNDCFLNARAKTGWVSERPCTHSGISNMPGWVGTVPAWPPCLVSKAVDWPVRRGQRSGLLLSNAGLTGPPGEGICSPMLGSLARPARACKGLRPSGRQEARPTARRLRPFRAGKSLHTGNYSQNWSN